MPDDTQTTSAAEAVDAYFEVHPLGGSRDETEPVIDALMVALREALNRKQRASDELRKARHSLNRVEGALRYDEHIIGELWHEISVRGWAP